MGKYAPFHRGHGLVIETALSEMDLVLVLIYNSHLTSIPLKKRADWIRRIYPERVKVIEAYDGPEETGYSPEIKRKQEAYVLKKLTGWQIHSFYSSEPYGEHMSRALGCRNRQVDCQRLQFPISATLLREDPYTYRRFLSPEVYFDHVIKVVFHGAPSTGKTTISEALARKFHTAWMPEYGREYWEKHEVDRRLSPRQLLEIACEHRKRELRDVYEARDFYFIDTCALSTYHFALDYHGTALPELCRLADEAGSRYDLHILCGDDIPYDDTPDRSGEVYRSRFQKRFEKDLQKRQIPYILLTGSLEERIEKVSILLKHTKELYSC